MSATSCVYAYVSWVVLGKPISVENKLVYQRVGKTQDLESREMMFRFESSRFQAGQLTS